MSTQTIEIPPDLAARLEEVAGPVPGEKERLVREALENLLEGRRAKIAARVAGIQPFPDGESAYDRMKHLCGIIEGPGDLSTNPKYLEGLGEE